VNEAGHKVGGLFASTLLLAGLLGLSPPVVAADSAATEPQASNRCVDVHIQGDNTRYLDCLNSELNREVAKQADREALLQTVVANSQAHSPTQMGLFNQTATHERLGNAFGHSVIPQRPVVTYVNPMIH
jgi:hypothetical protein